MRWLVPILFGLGCGPPRPRLPPEPAPLAPAVADPFNDRSWGRTGLGCADCHPMSADRLGPAPRFPAQAPYWGGSAATPAEAVQRCAERYLAVPGVAPATLTRLVEASARSAEEPALVRDPAVVYRAACASCHAGGPGPALRGRPWSAAAIKAAVRGTDTAPHPGRLMPPFTSDTLNDRILESLARWLSATEPGQPPAESAKFPREAPPGEPARGADRVRERART